MKSAQETAGFKLMLILMNYECCVPLNGPDVAARSRWLVTNKMHDFGLLVVGNSDKYPAYRSSQPVKCFLEAGKLNLRNTCRQKQHYMFVREK